MAIYSMLFFCFSVLSLPLLTPDSWEQTNLEFPAGDLDDVVFMLLFCFTLMPLINAVSDWLSVSFTQYCLSRYNNQSSWLLWVFCDFVVAIVMSTFVFVGIYEVLSLAESWGWQVSAKQIFDAFEADPFSADNRWLVFLVITNLIPTIVHLALLVGASFSAWYFLPRSEVNSLLAKHYRSLQADKPNDPREYTWSQTEASRVAEYIVGMRWIWALCVFSLLLPFLYAVYYLITVFLHKILVKGHVIIELLFY